MSEPLLPASAAARTAPFSVAPRPRRWGRGLLIGAALLLGLGLIAAQLLDPWLRRTLEKQIATQTHGQYQLQLGELHTSLWHRAIWLRRVRLRPAAVVADTLPRLRLDVGRVALTGVGLWEIVRHHLVPLDSVVLDSVRLQMLALAKKPTKNAALPLHERLPTRLAAGIRVGYVGLTRLQATYGPLAQPMAGFRQGSLSGHDILLSRTGAADTARLGYAAAWQFAVSSGQAKAGGHQVALAKTRFSSTTKRLEFDSLRIRPPAPGQGKPGAVRIDFTLPRLVVAGLRAATWQHQQHFQADSMLVEAPHLAFTPPTQPPPDLWKLLQPLTRRSDLAYVAVRNGQMRVHGFSYNPSLKAINAVITSLRIDSAARREPRRILYARAWTLNAGPLAATLEAPFYQAGAARLHLNTAARSVRLDGLTFLPAFTPVQMNVRYGYQVPQFNVRVGELAVTGLDFSALAHHGEVRAGRLTVRHPLIKIASDGRAPINPHTSVITPEAMRNLPIVLDVRRLDLIDGNLYARYRSPLSPKIGSIGITRFSGTLRNVSTDPRHQTAATPLTGTASAYLQNSCRMTVNLAVPLLDPTGRHRVWGSFGASPFSILNTMTVPTRLIAFKKGEVQHIDFAMQGDKKQITGTMTARYTGLQLELLSYKQGQVKQSLAKRILSKAANVLVIRDQNPRKSGRLITGDMTSKREPRFSVFVLWRQGVISGLLDNIGLPHAIAQKLSQAQDKASLPK